MRLNVNPNRMELLRLRHRLSLAERGHKLLKDKLEQLMQRFLNIIERLRQLQEEITPSLNKTFLSFALARCGSSKQELDEILPEGKLKVEVKKERIFNLSVPRIEIKEWERSEYDLLITESELDIGVKKTQELMEDLMELGRLWKAVELLSHEIETTRRRVNALEHILIPNIKETIKYISGRLEEMERSYQVQLMRIKEIIRSH